MTNVKDNTLQSLEKDKKFMQIVTDPYYSMDTRLDLLEQINNQEILTTIALTSAFFKIAKAATLRLSSQECLTNIATTAVSWRIRILAVPKLNDQITLAQIAMNDESMNVRKVAIENITNCDFLKFIFVNCTDKDLKQTIHKRVISLYRQIS